MVDKITNPPSQKDLIDKVNELVEDKQDTLVSGTNIKTINGTSILGSGNIDIQGGGSYTAGTGIDITNDVISVTNAISTGAALGATALQPSALNGYATQAWVGQQGYITGITSSDVTTALGYTPYNSTNPNGYITSSALTPYALSEDLASVATSGSYNDLSDKPTIPAAQVNSDWNATSGVARILNKPTIPTVNNPTITFTQGGTTKGTITLNQPTNQTVALDAGGSARNIGEIVTSTIPLSDAGLHLLDGSVIHGGGIYNDFYNYIAGIVNTYPNLFVTEGTWQAEVASHGVCGKFVFYEPNRTVRLPKITGFIEGTTDVTALGDLLQAGLPNITGRVVYGNGGDIGVNTSYVSGAFYADTGTNVKSASSGSQTNNHPLLFNASRSSPIYGRSNTVQPPAIKVLYYIVLATSTKTDIEVDIDEIATDLNGKADIDLSNCTKPYITETYVNGTSWYRVYSDGWCEQGGKLVRTITNGGEVQISLIKAYVNTSYNIQVSGIHISGKWGYSSIGTGAITANSFYVFAAGNSSPDGTQATYWETCGYIS